MTRQRRDIHLFSPDDRYLDNLDIDRTEYDPDEYPHAVYAEEDYDNNVPRKEEL
jgi:hypothetical protein